MRAEITATAEEIKQSIELLRRLFDWDASHVRLSELNALVEDQGLWDDADRAQKLMRERTQLEKSLNDVKQLEQDLADAVELIELGEMEEDADIVAEAEATILGLKEICEKRQIESLLSGEADGFDCYLEVHAGAGGTEAQDWAAMLLRMYTRWCESHGYKVDWLEESAGEEAELKSATIKVNGHNAYGWLKPKAVSIVWSGSRPMNAARRHTSFSSVWVYPVVDDSINIVIMTRICGLIPTARQARRTACQSDRSAIRITHIPTGIVVQCQNDRSQHRNRATALEMLKARLYEAELQRREEEATMVEAGKSDIGWGHQIRSMYYSPTRW